MRRLLFLLVPVLTAVAVLGCPLTIEVRCDDAFPGGYCLAECGTGGACPSGAVCVPELGRCLRACGEACTRPGYACGPVPGPGSPTQACAPAASNPGDGGTTNPGDGGTGEPTPDAGCVASVPLDGRCAQACECATAGASCAGGSCVRACASDWDCPEDRRCDEASEKCELGPRIGEACRDSFDCQSYVSCSTTPRRCAASCGIDAACPPGYRCAPDSTCVEDCSGVPETLGLTCESSLDCSRCGFCVASGTGSEKRCRQPCRLDRDCPGGATGACEQVGTTSLKACRLQP